MIAHLIFSFSLLLQGPTAGPENLLFTLLENPKILLLLELNSSQKKEYEHRLKEFKEHKSRNSSTELLSGITSEFEQCLNNKQKQTLNRMKELMQLSEAGVGIVSRLRKPKRAEQIQLSELQKELIEEVFVEWFALSLGVANEFSKEGLDRLPLFTAIMRMNEAWDNVYRVQLGLRLDLSPDQQTRLSQMELKRELFIQGGRVLKKQNYVEFLELDAKQISKIDEIIARLSEEPKGIRRSFREVQEIEALLSEQQLGKWNKAKGDK